MIIDIIDLMAHCPLAKQSCGGDIGSVAYVCMYDLCKNPPPPPPLLLAILGQLFWSGSLVILDVVCRYLSLFLLDINIKK